MLLHIFLSLVHWTSGSQFFLPRDQDVTKTGNGEQETGNRERGNGERGMGNEIIDVH